MSGELRPLQLKRRRRPPRDRAVLRAAWFARRDDHPTDAVSLLTLHGDDFVDQIFAGVVDWSRSPSAAHALWEGHRNAFRDYAEPPAAMLDGAGAPLYPPSVARRASSVDVDAAEARVACSAAGRERAFPPTTSAEPCATGLPPWQRKLYLPFHGDYQMAAFELVCQRPAVARGTGGPTRGTARVDPERIVRSGVLVRRLRRQRDAEIWEDWVHAGKGEGAWVHVADGAMHATSTGGPRPIDPDAPPIPSATLVDLTARLRCEPADLALSLAPVSPIPPRYGDAAEHTALVGLVPLGAEDVEAAHPPTRDAIAASIERHAERLEQMVARDFHTSDLSGLQLVVQQVFATWAEELLDTGWSTSVASPASYVHDPLLDPTPARKASLVATWLAGARGALAPHLYATARVDPEQGSGPAALDPDDWWSAALARLWSETPALHAWSGASGVELAWFLGALAHRRAGFEAHLRASFVGSAAVEVAGAAERGSDHAILAAALVQRIRSARAILYDHLVRHLHAVAPEAHAALYLRPAFAGVAPPFTQSSAADEITAWLEAERMRDTIPYPWPPLPLGVAPIPALIRLHEQSAGLEHLLSRFEALAREIGEPLDTLAAWHRERWAEALPTPPRDAGLDVHAQPLRGLAGFPTADPVRCQARLAEAIGEIRALEPPPSPAPLPPSTKRFLDRERATSMPRFDRDHLYAVWAFAEVAGHTCDEESQLVWSQRSEPFTIADPLDVLGLEPTQIQLPDVAAMLKDLPRVPWAGANPFAAVISANDGALVGADPPEDSSRQWGVAFVCSFAIPVFTICAFILFSVIFNILIKIPGFFWMLLLKFCIPLPRRTT